MSLYIYKNGQQLGPFEDHEIINSLRSGEHSYDDWCWQEGWEEWKPLSTLFPEASEACVSPQPPFAKKSKAKIGVIASVVAGVLIIWGGTVMVNCRGKLKNLEIYPIEKKSQTTAARPTQIAKVATNTNSGRVAQEIPSGIYQITGTNTCCLTNLATAVTGDITIPPSISTNGQNYTVNDVKLINIQGLPIKLTLPTTIPQISSNTFINCGRLQEVIIPEGITAIGEKAFNHCTNLESITIPSSVTKIESAAFYQNVNLTNFCINYPSRITNWGNRVFTGCYKLQKLTLPENALTSADKAGVIGKKCANIILLYNNFYERQSNTDAYIINTNSVSIDISSNTQCINNNQFNNQRRITNVLFEEPSMTTTIGAAAFRGCTSLEQINLPDKIQQIGEKAFSDSGLRSITIPPGVTVLEKSLFQGCKNLTSVTFAETSQLKKIGENVFSGCVNLQQIKMPNSLTCLGEGAFSKCGLTNIDFSTPSNVTNIEDRAFAGCSNLTSIALPDSIKVIGNHAFENCINLENIVLHQGITSIGNGAFINCPIKSIDIPSSVVTLGRGLGFSTSRENVLPVDKVKISRTLLEKNHADFISLGKYVAICNTMFEWKGDNLLEKTTNMISLSIPTNIVSFDRLKNPQITNIVFESPSSATTIEAGDFSRFINLQSITIPASITNISSMAFVGCKNLTNVIFLGDIPAMGDQAFDPDATNLVFHSSKQTSLKPKTTTDKKSYGWAWTILPRYEEARSFNKSNATWVKRNGKWFVINKLGRELTATEFDNVRDFEKNGYAIGSVSQNGKKQYGLIDEQGKMICKPEWDDIGFMQTGLVPVSKEKKWGYCDNTGKLVIPCVWDDAWRFSSAGTAVVVRNHIRGMINTDGKILIEPTWDGAINCVKEGLGAMRRGEKWALVDTNGKFLTDPEWEITWSQQRFDLGWIPVSKDQKIGLLGKNGKLLVQLDWDHYVSASGGGILLKGNGEAVFVGKDGITKSSFYKKIPSEFDFKDGRALVTEKNTMPPLEKNGFMDELGNLVVPYTNGVFKDYSEGYAAHQETETQKWGFINNSGVLNIPHEWDDVREFHCGRAAVMKSGKWGFIDRTGWVTVEPVYDEVKDYSDNMTAVKEDEGKWSVLRLNGSKAFELKDNDERINDFQRGVMKSDDCYYDKNGRKYAINWNQTRNIKPLNGEVMMVKKSLPMCFSYPSPLNKEHEDDQNSENNYDLVTTSGKTVLSGVNPYMDISSDKILYAGGRKYGWVDRDTGRVIFMPRWDDIKLLEHGFIGICTNGKWGVASREGRIIVNPEWEQILLGEGIIVAKNQNQIELYSFEGRHINIPTSLSNSEYVDTYGSGFIVRQAMPNGRSIYNLCTSDERIIILNNAEKVYWNAPQARAGLLWILDHSDHQWHLIRKDGSATGITQIAQPLGWLRDGDSAQVEVVHSSDGRVLTVETNGVIHDSTNSITATDSAHVLNGMNDLPKDSFSHQDVGGIQIATKITRSKEGRSSLKTENGSILFEDSGNAHIVDDSEMEPNFSNNHLVLIQKPPVFGYIRINSN